MELPEIRCRSDKPLDAFNGRAIQYQLKSEGLVYIGQAKLHVTKYEDGTFWVRLETVYPQHNKDGTLTHWLSLPQELVRLIRHRTTGKPGSTANPDLEVIGWVPRTSFWKRTFFPEGLDGCSTTHPPHNRAA